MITKIAPRKTAVATREKPLKRITVFHCVNSVGALSSSVAECEIKAIRMPCSSMTREVFLLRAFEAGADAVIVMVCPEGSCRYLEGNLRAGKRVARVQQILDEIGLAGRRLSFAHVSDEASISEAINRASSDLDVLGPNPATSTE
ncbi:MAG: hydrogenase iron-sulfur subunit [Dehalococcoidales bacterium]|nr:hydrogenase iron-sulfur subunit [Dehalococcoidales bacterium]